MAKVFEGKFTTRNDEEVVVFIIGMRINKRWKIRKWGQVFLAKPPMIRELHENKEELGFLSMESYFGLRTALIIQYWKSVDHLQAYAKAGKHLAAWQDFNRKIGNNDAVGIFHETYRIAPGDYESVYRNMPKFGLGKALEHIPVDKHLNSAEKRFLAGKRKLKKA